MKKYQIIYADPPWAYPESGTKAKVHNKYYKCQDLNWIKSLPVRNISDINSILFIWTTFPRLQESFQVIESWGFSYKTVGFIWVKANKRVEKDIFGVMPFDDFMGCGAWTRSNAEICLIGIKGKPKRISCKERQIIYSPIKRHSEKPLEAKERIIRLCGDIERIELFAREKTEGWDVWGNEVESDIDLLADSKEGERK